MIKIQLEELLEDRGHTFYWLAKQTGIGHNTLWRMKTGQTSGISFDVLEKITDALECEPGDVIVKIRDKKNKTK